MASGGCMTHWSCLRRAAAARRHLPGVPGSWAGCCELEWPHRPQAAKTGPLPSRSHVRPHSRCSPCLSSEWAARWRRRKCSVPGSELNAPAARLRRQQHNGLLLLIVPQLGLLQSQPVLPPELPPAQLLKLRKTALLQRTTQSLPSRRARPAAFGSSAVQPTPSGMPVIRGAAVGAHSQRSAAPA